MVRVCNGMKWHGRGMVMHCVAWYGRSMVWHDKGMVGVWYVMTWHSRDMV